MKKLIFVFVALFILVLISGCNARNNNTVRFDDNTADITSETTEDESVTEETSEETVSENTTEEAPVIKPFVEKEASGKLEILSFDGGFLKTNLDHNVVRGGASSDTVKVTINDYELNQFTPGSGEWSYIASGSLGTMKEGWNNYVVKTFDKKGTQLGSLIFSIEYDAPVTPESLPHVGNNAWLALLIAISGSSAYFTLRKKRWL
jgi:hypothetical protein